MLALERRADRSSAYSFPAEGSTVGPTYRRWNLDRRSGSRRMRFVQSALLTAQPRGVRPCAARTSSIRRVESPPFRMSARQTSTYSDARAGPDRRASPSGPTGTRPSPALDNPVERLIPIGSRQAVEAALSRLDLPRCQPHVDGVRRDPDLVESRFLIAARLASYSRSGSPRRAMWLGYCSYSDSFAVTASVRGARCYALASRQQRYAG